MRREFWLAGGNMKKWRWSSPDEAGTRPISARDRNAQEVAKIIRKFHRGELKPGNVTAYDVARGQGRRIVFIDQDGVFWSEQAEPTHFDRATDFLLPITYKDKVPLN